jgi:hypothetical protein
MWLTSQPHTFAAVQQGTAAAGQGGFLGHDDGLVHVADPELPPVDGLPPVLRRPPVLAPAPPVAVARPPVAEVPPVLVSPPVAGPPPFGSLPDDGVPPAPVVPPENTAAPPAPPAAVAAPVPLNAARSSALRSSGDAQPAAIVARVSAEETSVLKDMVFYPTTGIPQTAPASQRPLQPRGPHARQDREAKVGAHLPRRAPLSAA